MTKDELPEGWAIAKLSDVAVLQRGYDLPVQDRKLGFIPIYGGNGIIGTHSVAKVAGPGVVTGRSGTIGKVEIIDRDFWPLNTALYVSDFKDNDHRFVALLLRHLDLKTYLAGTGVPTLNRNVIHEVEVPLPPLAEQKRIVAAVERILDKVNAARARLDRVPKTLKRFRQAVLAAACSGRLTADWREKNPGQASATAKGEVGFEELPEAWEWVRFGSQLRSIRSGSTTPPKNDPTAFPILRSSSVRQGSVDLSDVKYLSPDESTNPDNYLTDGDLLFTRLSGSLEYVANCARVSISAKRLIQYPDRLFCAKLLEPGNADYFVYAFASPIVRKTLTEGAKSSAGHQRVSIGNITSQLIPLPPLAEQQEIVKRVAALFARADALEAKVNAARKRVDTLTQAVLAKAFRGELVPTEAELARRENRPYESASELLARVRTSAITATPKPKRTRKKSDA